MGIAHITGVLTPLAAVLSVLQREVAGASAWLVFLVAQLTAGVSSQLLAERCLMLAFSDRLKLHSSQIHFSQKFLAQLQESPR